MTKRNSRICKLFDELGKKKETALICYTIAGYPSIQTSMDVVDSLVKGGMDILEIGIPFSDPIADGPTIQKASFSALQNGITYETALALARQIREKYPELPTIFMTYSNIPFVTGLTKFIIKSKRSGIDGLILPDMSIEESKSYCEEASHLGLSTIFLASPNSSDSRIKKIIERTTGFLYLVSVYGVTGARKNFDAYTIDSLKKVKKIAGDKIPIVVGFGISKPLHVKLMASAGANGVIVASAILDEISKFAANKTMLNQLTYFTRSMKNACTIA